jgi:hypothetical protein
MGSAIYLLTRDLLFRSKLAGVATGAGWKVTRDATTCERAVVELGATGWEDRLRELIGRGIPAIVFGPHVDAELLRRARTMGATVVPNSQVEDRLRAMLEPPDKDSELF